MKLDKLYVNFKNLFPNDSDFFKEIEKKYTIDDTDDMHVIFGTVICPFLHKVVEEDQEKAKVAFDYIEQMLTYGDDDVTAVAEVSVLEIIITDENGGINKFRKFLGEKSMESVKHLSQFFDINK